VLSPALLAGAVFSFLLPFGTVSCGAARVEVTGVELVSGSRPQARCAGPVRGCTAAPTGPLLERSFDLSRLTDERGGPLARVAFVAALVAAGLSLARRSRAASLAAGAGAAALLVLALEPTRGPRGTAAESLPPLVVHRRYGLWLALLLLAVAAVALALERRGRASPVARVGLAGAAAIYVGLLVPYAIARGAGSLGDRAYVDAFATFDGPGYAGGVARFAVPVAAAVAASRGSAVAAGSLLGFGAETLLLAIGTAAAVASSATSAWPGPGAFALGAGAALLAAAGAVAARPRERPRAGSRWVAPLALGGAVLLAVAVGASPPDFAGRRWLLLEPAGGAVLAGAAAFAVDRWAAARGVLLAAGLQLALALGAALWATLANPGTPARWLVSGLVGAVLVLAAGIAAVRGSRGGAGALDTA
jgi:hypothetical protein